jgi:hypothetical protein
VPDGARGKGECGGDLGVGPAWTTAEALAEAFSAPTGLMPGPERRPIRSRSTPRLANCNRPSANSGTSPGDCTPWSSGMPDWPLPFGRRRIQTPANHRNPGRPVLRRGRIHGVHARRAQQRSRTVDRCRPSRSIHAGRGRRNRRPAGIARRDRLPDNHPRRGQSHIRLPERTHPNDLDATPLATSGQVKAGTRGSR